MELQSFEKPYSTLLNSANWANGGPVDKPIGASPGRDYVVKRMVLGGAMIKSPKIFYCPFGFFSLGIPRYILR